MASPQPSAANSGAQPGSTAIVLRDVCREFTLEDGTKVNAVDGVSLHIPGGEFVCVLGPSGHGKSTLLNMIAGFLPPTAGTIEVDGRPVTGPGADRGVVFQRDTLFSWRRVADNIGFGLQAKGMNKAQRTAIVDRYLKLTGLERFGRAWPKQLSGGMRRRVAIAAVFANEPEVLLMDEPFVGLDYGRRAQLHEVLLELWGRSRNTVFFITHDVDEAIALGDRILCVLDGRIALDERVDLERPRTNEALASPKASELRTRIMARLNPNSWNA
jgi:NitT/TauT family transport system ATP-binding protein